MGSKPTKKASQRLLHFQWRAEQSARAKDYTLHKALEVKKLWLRKIREIRSI
ncbi:unnamed protein product [Brassica rapa]|uniref:Uncharacterized protein n=1 Tax=Brassica campestris TaxID=3711 RepID=A0A3P6D4S4_BRACM|nr:unnamed protein product [Brassica rapa]VDD17405.1 unnamed protein product [Brassica rapa]